MQDRIESLVDDLTLDEKIQLVHGVAPPEGRATGYVPGVERLGIPPLKLVDGPLGIRAEGESATAFPASISLASSWNPSLAREQGAAMAREAKAYDQDVLFGPGVNIVRVPEGGRNFEYYTEDPYLNARLAAECVTGIQSEDVVASIKHYVANNQETNRYDVSAEIDERTLREIYLPAFRAAVEEADVQSVMTAYNRVNGIHMSDHARLVSEVLKGEYDFDGFVVSDWWGTKSTVDAANAGLDLEMPGTTFEDISYELFDAEGVDPSEVDIPDFLPNMRKGRLFGESLRDAVESGSVSELVLDEKVRRILRTMDSIGLLDDADREGELDTPEHRQLARRVAIEGAVLLQNDGTLPIDSDESVALIGPNADSAKLGGGGSSEVAPFVETAPLDAFRERATDISFERGIPPVEETSLFDAFVTDETEADSTTSPDASLDDAVAATEKADTAVVIVQDDTTEALDRDSLRLPGRQDELISAVAEAAKRTVVILRTSGPIEMPWLDEVDAVLEMWYPGQADGNALADILFGEADPGGRLPVTFGRSVEDYPTNGDERFPGVGDEARYDEGIFVGYRHFDEQDIDPAFPFGHGLSYGEYEYGEATVESADSKLVVTIPVQNVGERQGTETVQVYVRKRDTPAVCPGRELKGFARVTLAPGEQTDVSVTLDRDAFTYYDEESGWTELSGTHELLVGRSSRNVQSTTDVTIPDDF
ncbi:beta-glucosidase [Halomicrococcus sp. NG-SE-24]|uniref:beta-glucosidase n=1 Tax=Halomicrococcus sp. NG-SE-24 TaxID=3436928 RepID=UPI003D966999